MKEDKIFKTVFITKYWQTKGIYKINVELKNNLAYQRDNFIFNVFSKKDYFLTREEAEKDCEERRVKKLQSLEEQIQKLNKLNFQ